jgi:hypothetical protein
MSNAPYRDPAPTSDQEPEYFVKVKDGADERGPYTLEALRSSFKRQLLNPSAMIRPAKTAVWMPLRKVIEAHPEPEVPPTLESILARDERQAFRVAPTNNVTIGFALIAAGVTLSTLSYAAGGSHFSVFWGLVIAGIVRMIRT